MSDTLSHLAAATLGQASTIRPQQSAFFAAQAPPPAGSLAEAVAILRAKPAPPPSPSTTLLGATPLLRDPALTGRPAPSLRRLAQATAAAGDLSIAPLSSWSPPLVEEMGQGPASIGAADADSADALQQAGPGSTAGQAQPPAAATPLPARQQVQPIATVEPSAAGPLRNEPASAHREAGQRQPAVESSRPESAQTSPAPALPLSEMGTPAGSQPPDSPAVAPRQVGQTPFQSETLETGAPAAEPAPSRPLAPDPSGQSAAAIHPTPTMPVGSTRLSSTGEDPLPASAAPGQVEPADLGRRHPAGAPLEPAQAMTSQASQPAAKPATTRSSHDTGQISARPAVEPAVSVSTPAKDARQPATLQPEPAIVEQERAATRYGLSEAQQNRVSAQQERPIAKQSRPVARQGWAISEQGRLIAEQGSKLLPQKTQGLEANVEPAQITIPAPAPEGPAQLEREPGQPAPAAGVGPGQPRPASTTTPAGQAAPVKPQSKVIGTSRTGPVLEPVASGAGQPPQRPVSQDQPGQANSLASEKPADGASVDIWPDVAPVIQPALQSPPGAGTQPVVPASPARPTIEITIGRIEVRLRPKAAPSPQPAPRPKPALSLDDYLSQPGGRR